MKKQTKKGRQEKRSDSTKRPTQKAVEGLRKKHPKALIDDFPNEPSGENRKSKKAHGRKENGQRP